MPRTEGFEAYVSFRYLGGGEVTAEEICAEIARWPLDAVLGFLGAVSSEMLQRGHEFFDPRFQGGYLNLAIVDEFPRPLARATDMYGAGRVPITGGIHILAHEHNLAWLAHAALMHADRTRLAPELTYEFRRRALRLLLLINDVLPAERSARGLGDQSTLSQRRTAAIDWLRHYQFNRYSGGQIEANIRVVRQRIIMLDILPRFYPVEAAFEEATGGVTLRLYFEALSLLIAHIHEAGPERRWLSRATMCSQIRGNREAVESLVFGRWTRTPEAYSRRVLERTAARPDDLRLPDYDYVPLREAPLIEARTGELICPVLPMLLAKAEDDPYFILCDHLRGDRTRQVAFQQAMGKAFEEYAKGLVIHLRETDTRGAWGGTGSPRSPDGDEITDDLMLRHDVAVCIEHKGLRVDTEFLTGGHSDRVLGPEEEILARLDNREAVDHIEGRRRDPGYITRGLWQLSCSEEPILAYAAGGAGARPALMYPLLVHLSGLPVDKIIYTIYLEHLLKAARLLDGRVWAPPQWLHISDLESLVTLAERGQLDLLALLREKSQEPWKKTRFDIYLQERRFGTRPPRLLTEAAIALLRDAQATFFPDEPQDGTMSMNNREQ